METAELEFSTSIRIGAGLPEVEGMVRLHRAECLMHMLLEQPEADAAAVEDLTIAIRSPEPDIRFNASMCRAAAHCSLNDPASMLRDFTDAADLLAAHRPLIEPLLPRYGRDMRCKFYRKQGQRDHVCLMNHIMQMFPKQLACTAQQLDLNCSADCQVMCRAVQAAKARLAGAKAQAGQPKDAAIARAKERGGNSYRHGDYAAALEAYSQAIETANAAASSLEADAGCACNASPSARATLYSNRAATHIKLGAWEAAVQDCSSALALEPCCVKASLRRVHATLQLHESLGLAGSLGGDAQPRRRDWHGELKRCNGDLSAVTADGKDDGCAIEECKKLAQRMLAHTQSIAQQHVHGAVHPPASAPGAAPAPGHAAGGAEAEVASSSSSSMCDKAAAGATEAADSLGGFQPIILSTVQLRSMCAHCGKPGRALPGRKLKVCMRCRVEEYCSEACQRAHWPHHKAACKKIAEDRTHRSEFKASVMGAD